MSRLQARSRLFLDLARKAGLDTGHSRDSAVIPVIIGDSRLALGVSQALYEQGILALPIVHPAVSPRNARVRFFLTSQHTTDQIGFTVECLAKLVKTAEMNVPSA